MPGLGKMRRESVRRRGPCAMVGTRPAAGVRSQLSFVNHSFGRSLTELFGRNTVHRVQKPHCTFAPITGHTHFQQPMAPGLGVEPTWALRPEGF